MSILVTGGAGFIGSRLVSYLIGKGESVHILDLPSQLAGELVNEKVRYFCGSILNGDDVRRAMNGCDRVYHLAAYAKNWAPSERTFYEVNVGGTEIVLKTAMSLHVRRIVHTSSNVSLGPSNGVQVEESSVRKSDFYTPYEGSKYMSEQMIRQYVKRGLNVVTVNPTRVFGPGPLNESNSVTKMIDWYLHGMWRFILGDGRMVGNYVFVDDLIDGYVRAMEFGKSGERYILGGENISFNGFFELLSTISRRRYRMFHLPAPLAMAFSRVEEFRSHRFNHYPIITPGWARTFLCDWANSCRKAERDLGYTITPLDRAMERTIEWLRHGREKQTSLVQV